MRITDIDGKTYLDAVSGGIMDRQRRLRPAREIVDAVASR